MNSGNMNMNNAINSSEIFGASSTKMQDKTSKMKLLEEKENNDSGNTNTNTKTANTSSLQSLQYKQSRQQVEFEKKLKQAKKEMRMKESNIKVQVQGQPSMLLSSQPNPNEPELSESPDLDLTIIPNVSNSNPKTSSKSKLEEGKEQNVSSNSIVLNYAYAPSSTSIVIDTSGVCDFGFRNLETISKLTPDDCKQLSEKYFDKLSLSHNALKGIPHYFLSTFPKLEMLLVLDLSCNQLTHLPNDLDHLANLTHLNLFLNKLRCLPPSLGQLQHLKWLNIGRNPELMKSTYLKKLAGPMLTEKQCFECATNVKKWVNAVVERRATLAAEKSGNPNALPKTAPELTMDDQLLRFQPINAANRKFQNAKQGQNHVFEFVDEDENGDTLNKLSGHGQIPNQGPLSSWTPLRITKMAIVLWLSSIILVIFMSAIIAPFILNEKSRRYWTSKGLLTIPEFLVDASIYIGRGLHDVLGGLPCKLFLQKNCSYCYPKSPGFWDLVLWRWFGFGSR